jgi:hypothetical protein
MRKTSTKKSAPEGAKGPSKLEILLSLLRQPSGASIAELATATGWQHHSVRGALAGTLKKKGHSVHSDVVDGLRRYRIAEPSA